MLFGLNDLICSINGGVVNSVVTIELLVQWGIQLLEGIISFMWLSRGNFVIQVYLMFVHLLSWVGW